MPMYNAPLWCVDQKEARRYAGLAKAPSFDERMIAEACEDAQLLSVPRGIWEAYDYICDSHRVQADPPLDLVGSSIAKHLSGCDRVIFLAVTVGEEIEREVARRFQAGDYTSAILLDAAATAAVEQVADAMEDAIRPGILREGYGMKWRFSPGYGDWPLAQQPDALRLCHGERIGVALTESLMLVPRKSVTAVIGLARNEGSASKGQGEGKHRNGQKEQTEQPKGCAACGRLDCPSRT